MIIREFDPETKERLGIKAVVPRQAVHFEIAEEGATSVAGGRYSSSGGGATLVAHTKSITKSNKLLSKDNKDKSEYGSDLVNRFIKAVQKANNGMLPTARSVKTQRQAYWNCLQLLGVRKKDEVDDTTKKKINNFCEWLFKQYAEKQYVIQTTDTLKQKVHYFLVNIDGK